MSANFYRATLLLGGALFIVSACSTLSSREPDARWADYREWRKASEIPSTGDPSGLTSTVHAGAEGYRDVYVNATGESVMLGDGPYVYPVGTVIVKTQFKNKTAWEAQKNPDMTIAVKASEGTGVDTWLWADSYTGTADKNGFCSGCHTAASKDDFIFTNGAFIAKHLSSN